MDEAVHAKHWKTEKSLASSENGRRRCLRRKRTVVSVKFQVLPNREKFSATE